MATKKKETTTQSPKVKGTAANDATLGKVTKVAGPVVDVKFNDGYLPKINSALKIDVNGKDLYVEVGKG